VSDWREKIKQITDGIGPIGDAVYREIVESVEEAISDAREEGRWSEIENQACIGSYDE